MLLTDEYRLHTSTLVHLPAIPEWSDFDLISDALPLGRLWYGGPNAASNALSMRSFTAGHMMPSSAFTMKLAV